MVLFIFSIDYYWDGFIVGCCSGFNGGKSIADDTIINIIVYWIDFIVVCWSVVGCWRSIAVDN